MALSIFRRIQVGKHRQLLGRIVLGEQSRSLVAPATAGRFNSTNNVIAPEHALDEVRLNNLWDNPGALKKGKRVGRGPGSGKGKTAGRGQKGQKARNRPGPGIGFEGGQTPLYRRVRKYGFSNASFRKEFAEISLLKLQQWLEQGRLNAEQPITMKDLVAAGAVKSNKVRAGIKLVGNRRPSDKFTFEQPIVVEVSRVSAGARKALEQAQSKVYCVYYNRLGLRALLRQQSFVDRPLMPRFARVPLPKTGLTVAAASPANPVSATEEQQQHRQQLRNLYHPCEVPSAPRFGLSKDNARPFHPSEHVY